MPEVSRQLHKKGVLLLHHQVKLKLISIKSKRGIHQDEAYEIRCVFTNM